MASISVLVKPASGNCNMNCDYCFYCDEASKRENKSYGMMSFDTIKNVIRRTLLRATEVYSIAFQGGEPTLVGLDFYREVVRLIEKYNKNNCRIQIALQTNGAAINEDWCQFFKNNNVLVGISIDGLKEIHDKYRHLNSDAEKSSFDRNVEVTRLFDKYSVDYNVLTVVHREVAESIGEIYRNYRKRGWNYMQFISCLDPIGEVRGKQEYSLTPELYGLFLIDLFNEWYKDVKAGNAPYIRQFENYLGILLGYRPESCEQVGRCGIAYTVEADGSVFPCDFYALDDMRLGNFNTDLLPAIDEKRHALKFVERSNNQPADCKECKWHRLCRGGCYRSRFTAEDERVNAGEEGLNYFCQGYKRFFEQCYEKLIEISEHI